MLDQFEVRQPYSVRSLTEEQTLQQSECAIAPFQNLQEFGRNVDLEIEEEEVVNDRLPNMDKRPRGHQQIRKHL